MSENTRLAQGPVARGPSDFGRNIALESRGRETAAHVGIVIAVPGVQEASGARLRRGAKTARVRQAVFISSTLVFVTSQIVMICSSLFTHPRRRFN